jgi:hypothetical protein
MEQRDLLLRAIDALERASIPYAITGSWASISYGVPRTTHDSVAELLAKITQA